MAQDASFCADTTDAVLPGVLGLLPEGPAWAAASVEGTVHNKFWRAISTPIAWVNARLCQYVDELYCSTAKESLDQWAMEYDYNPTDECNAYPSLCAKVHAYGGQTCDYYVTLAASIGWIIQCSDLMDTPLPIAGCMQAGCTPLAPKVRLASGCTLGPSANAGDTSTPVPGPGQHVVSFNRPAVSTTEFDEPCLYDSTGQFLAYTGYAHVMVVTIDIAASTNAQKNDPMFRQVDWSDAGCIQAGCFRPQKSMLSPVLCWLEAIKPAHTQIVYKVINNG